MKSLLGLTRSAVVIRVSVSSLRIASRPCWGRRSRKAVEGRSQRPREELGHDGLRSRSRLAPGPPALLAIRFGHRAPPPAILIRTCPPHGHGCAGCLIAASCAKLGEQL